MKIQDYSRALLHSVCLLGFSLSLACQPPAKSRQTNAAQESLLKSKVDSRLLMAMRESRTGKIENTVPVTLPKDSIGTVRVELRAKVSDSLLRFLRDSGASGVKAFQQLDVLQCGLPLSVIGKVASRKDVHYISPAPEMQLDVEPR